jgi:hypothetical protein
VCISLSLSLSLSLARKWREDERRMKNTLRLAVLSFSYWRSFAKKEKKLKTKNSKKE